MAVEPSQYNGSYSQIYKDCSFNGMYRWLSNEYVTRQCFTMAFIFLGGLREYPSQQQMLSHCVLDTVRSGFAKVLNSAVIVYQ